MKIKLREWILTNTEEKGKEGIPLKVYTSPDAGRDIAYRKLCAKVSEKFRFCVGLKRGKIVEI